MGQKKVSHWCPCIFIVITFHLVCALHILRAAEFILVADLSLVI